MSEIRGCEQCGRPVGDKVRFGLCAGCLFESYSTRTGLFSPDHPDPNAEALREDFKVGAGRFRLMHKLGEGGMGQIWLAEDSRLDGKRVALKFIRDAWKGAPDLVRELRLELARTRDLQHPHIVKVHDWHDPGDEPPFISMEYVDGCSLVSILKESPEGLDYRRLHPLLLQVSEALEYAHERHGALHRDIKPGNILVNRSGARESAKLSDFGIGLYLGQTAAPHEIPRGTRAYMSANHALGAPQSVADDIFSWGATFFHLLTGRPPYGPDGPGVNPREIRLQEEFGDANRLKAVPQPVRAMLLNCIHPEPARRPQRMGDLARILRANPPLQQNPTAGSPYALRVGDILDLPSLATRLEQCGRSIDAWAGEQLSTKTRTELESFLRGGGNPESLKRLLAQDLGGPILGASVFEADRFQGIELRAETLNLLERQPQGEQLEQLNRFLLEDAYPDELRRIGETEDPPPKWRRWAIVLALLASGLYLGAVHGHDIQAWLRHVVFGPPTRWAFRGEDILDPEALLPAPGTPPRPIDDWLARNLSRETLESLRSPARPTANVRARNQPQRLAARDLNGLLGPRSLFDPERFDGVELRDPTRARVSESKDVDGIYAMNRFLLEDAFPKALRRREVGPPDPGGKKSSLSLSIRSSPGKAVVSLIHLDTTFVVATNVELKAELSQFVFQDLRTGKYALRIAQDAFQYDEKQFTLNEGPTQELEVSSVEFNASLQIIVEGIEQARYVLSEIGKPGRQRSGSISNTSQTLRLTVGEYELGLGDASEILYRHRRWLASNANQEVRQRFGEAVASFSAFTSEGNPIAATVGWNQDGKPLSAKTPTPPIRFLAGERTVTVSAPGYQPVAQKMRFDRSPRTTNVMFFLKHLSNPIPGESYQNGLRMRFAPLPAQAERHGAAWIGCTEVTIRQFADFADDVRESFDGMKCLTPTGMVHFEKRSFRDPGFRVTDIHPATGVSWIDANRFCDWLTARQREAGSLPPNLRYALMTARDWELACTLLESRRGGANFAGLELEGTSDWPREWTEPEMLQEKDDFPFTAPAEPSDPSSDAFAVGNLFDNVQEWCADEYQPELNDGHRDQFADYQQTLGSWRYSAREPYRVVCGGSWFDHDPLFWRSSTRHAALPTERTSYRGFRVMIVDTADRRSP